MGRKAPQSLVPAQWELTTGPQSLDSREQALKSLAGEDKSPDPEEYRFNDKKPKALQTKDSL